MFQKKLSITTRDFTSQYFAGVSIEDPRLAVMCDKAGLPQPYSILTECVQRLDVNSYCITDYKSNMKAWVLCQVV